MKLHFGRNKIKGLNQKAEDFLNQVSVSEKKKSELKFLSFFILKHYENNFIAIKIYQQSGQKIR